MRRGRGFAAFLALSLLMDAICIPADLYRLRKFADSEVHFNSHGQMVSRNSEDIIRVVRQDNATKTIEVIKTGANETQKPPLDPSATLPPVTDDYEAKKKEYQTPEPYEDDDDDDDFDEPMDVAQTNNGGGISIFSLINLISALFPGSTGTNVILTNIVRQFLRNQGYGFTRRKDVGDNEIDIDYIQDLKPPAFQRQETEEDTESNASDSDSVEENSKDDDNAAEEIDNDDDDNSKVTQGNTDSGADSNANGNDSDYDSDEPPGGGDGEGGGLLGLLAGLSGGEDGQSDLGSLLATVGGIVANLSGDGFDLNAILASGIGLFVGLLSEGEENPGAVIASYLLTSLDTITGGGSNNNGAFFGSLISKLLKGTSAAPEGSSEENSNEMQMKDSAGFFASFLMALLGDMSKGSSGGSSH